MTQDDQAGTVERMVKIGLFWMHEVHEVFRSTVPA